MQVRPIQSQNELDTIYKLTYEEYIREGYCPIQSDRRLIHFPHLDNIPETTVLVALIEDQIVGTNSLTVDGENKLHVDIDFPKEVSAIRAEGRKLAASWRIIVDRQSRNNLLIIKTLILRTIRLALDLGIETCLFTFNPKHKRFYQRYLKMKTIAYSDSSRNLINAPMVLMRLDKEDLCPQNQ